MCSRKQNIQNGTTEIIEGNKLIAEFMGGKYMPYTEGMFGHFEHFMFPELQYDGNFIRINDLQYCSSWDWLMPVIENIGSLESNMCAITIGMFYEGDIHEVWRHVVSFIQWYNKAEIYNVQPH